MKETKHTAFRLSRIAKKMLAELSAMDELTMTDCVNNLIVAEFRYRRNDIEEYRKRIKNEERKRLSDTIK